MLNIAVTNLLNLSTGENKKQLIYVVWDHLKRGALQAQPLLFYNKQGMAVHLTTPFLQPRWNHLVHIFSLRGYVS